MKLFHASQQTDLTELKPQYTLSNNKYIGDYLFATKNFKMALMYLTPKGIPILMEPGEDPYIVICSSVEDFKKKDKGGAVYILSSDTFMKTPQEGLSDYELVSTTAVKPKDKKVYSNVLNALIDNGILVKFVDNQQFESLIDSKNQKHLINKLPNYKS